MKRLSRRQFVGGLGAASVFTIVPRHVLGAQPGTVAPNDRIAVASIGLGGMGAGDVQNVGGDKGVQMVALCDVDDKRGAGSFQKFPDAKKFKDFRKMFDAMEKSIDAVTVSTPDHTHAVAAMAALKRKKHVYCQKPLAHSVWEIRQLMKAAKEAGVVTQLGNQGHSSESIRVFCEMIWTGAIGNVHTVQCGCQSHNSHLGKLEAIRTEKPPVPDTLDWDLWLGPAMERPYHNAYCPGAWRGWVPFGNGTIGDWICHVVDPVFWALDLGAPKTIVADVGDWDPKSQGDTYPAKDKVTFEFPANGKRGPVTLIWHSGKQSLPRPEELEAERKVVETGAVVIGDKGKIMYGSHGAGGVRLLPESKMKTYAKPEKTIPRVRGHYGDWIDSIRAGGGKKSGSDFSYGGPLSELAMLGIIAMKLKGQKLEWDGPGMKFTNSPEANALINPPYRKGWAL